MENTPTSEQIQGHIRAAFDSVNLISEVLNKTSTEDNKKNVKRNYQHLELMLSKTWFAQALTEQQDIDINNAITSGKTYAE
jgi:hypothetical protein